MTLQKEAVTAGGKDKIGLDPTQKLTAPMLRERAMGSHVLSESNPSSLGTPIEMLGFDNFDGKEVTVASAEEIAKAIF